MRSKSVADLRGWVRPFHSGVESFGVLAEYDHVDERFFESASGLLANEVQRIAGEADAGTHADVEIELLTHGDDWAEVIELAAQFGLDLGVGFLLWLGSNGAEETKFVLGEQLDRAPGKGIAFGAPTFPTDVGANIVGFEADGVEHANGFGQYLVTDAVAGHSDDCALFH